MEQAAFRRFNLALVCHTGAHERESFRQVDHTLLALHQVGTYQVLKIDGIFTAHQRPRTRLCRRDVSAGQGTFLAVLVLQFKYVAQLGIRTGVAKTAQGIAVPQHTVILIGNDEGTDTLVLYWNSFFILAFVVELIGLVLPQA